MKILLKSFFLIGLASLFFQCSDSESSDPTSTDPDPIVPDVPLTDQEILAQTLDLPETPFNYANPVLPNHFNAPPALEADNTPNNNAITDEGATLGRVLFYDKKMSQNNTKACASCHLQANSFTDPDTFSEGFEGGFTGRNSMSLANARYYENGKFFWDERATTLEDQVLMPIQDHIEMGMTLEALTEKLQVENYYHILFTQVYGDSVVTPERVSLALSQFVRAMISYQSKYDEGRSANPGPPDTDAPFDNFSDEENLGKAIFFDAQRGGCAGCHGTDMFIGREALNNGLEAASVDAGLGEVTGNAEDVGKFKVPSLRNVAVTGPFMHDGRFATLEDVIEHYNSGMEAHPNLADRLKTPNGQPRRLNLSEEEKIALVAFLETLTDTQFLTDEKFADPFL